MPYLLDGNNLIGHVRRTARPGEEDRRALVAELAERLRATRARAVLFFDGPGGGRGSTLGPLTIREAAPGSGGADEAILEEVARAKAPGECIVVTADRGLAARVRDAGGRVCWPEDFFARFGRGAGRAAGRGPGPDRVDVEDWIGWFRDERNRGR
jgi:hypothetical protein